MSASLDTSILIALVTRQNPGQADKAEALVADAKALHIADLAMVEMVCVLERVKQLPRHIVAEVVSKLLENGTLIANRELFQRALPLYTRWPKLSFNDCCLASYAALNEAVPLYTYDKKLASQLPAAQLL